MKYIVVARHRSEFPRPICFAKGRLIVIGQKYEGPEGWDNWYLCRTPDGLEGWVPGQLIEQIRPGKGKALEDYTALELNVDAGDVLTGTRTLNAWVWCHRSSDAGSGWVPLKNLQEIGND